MYSYTLCNRFCTVFDQQITQTWINYHLSHVVILRLATSLMWSTWLHIQRHTITANSVKVVCLWSKITILWIEIITGYSVSPADINTTQRAQAIFPFNESDKSRHRGLPVIEDKILFGICKKLLIDLNFKKFL